MLGKNAIVVTRNPGATVDNESPLFAVEGRWNGKRCAYELLAVMADDRKGLLDGTWEI